ncbi:MAG: hypothetical protein ACPLQS_02550 [Desulfurococcaceae archaeon]
MRVGLFFDFDGVLAPITENPLDVSVPSIMMNTIRSMQREYTIAVISGRDCPFLYNRIPGLNGYACIFGLEIHGGGYTVLDDEAYFSDKPRIISELAFRIEKIIGDRGGLILGRTLTGVPIGMSVYWYLDKGKPVELDELIEEAKKSKLVVNPISRWGNVAEFIEIHVSKRTKGESLRILKTLLGVDKVVYFGDSYRDIPAFNEADIRVLVKHEYNSSLSNVNVDYVVNQAELPQWLKVKLEEAHGQL